MSEQLSLVNDVSVSAIQHRRGTCGPASNSPVMSVPCGMKRLPPPTRGVRGRATQQAPAHQGVERDRSLAAKGGALQSAALSPFVLTV